jgi:hypothetical protein
MTRYVVGAVLVLALAAGLYAQRAQLPPYYKRLGLSDVQKKDVYKVRNDFKAKRDKLTAELAQLKTDEQAALEKILTPTQRQLLRELKLGPAGKKDDTGEAKKKEGTVTLPKKKDGK